MRSCGRSGKVKAVQELQDALHDLAQPLTALAFLTEIGRMQGNPKLWKAALESAAIEVRRAIETQRVVLAAAERLSGPEARL